MKLAAAIIAFCIVAAPQYGYACPLFSTCKGVAHHIKKAKLNPVITKHEKRIADLEQRLLLAEAMLAAHEAALGAQQHQLSRLAPK